MLHADGAVGDQRVEDVAVERAGDRVVVADAAQPGANRKRAGGVAQGRGERVEVADSRRAARDRFERGRHRHEMEMVVVQTGEKSATRGIEHGVTLDGEPRRDLDDDAVADAHVEPGHALDLASGDEQARRPVGSVAGHRLRPATCPSKIARSASRTATASPTRSTS